MLGHENVAITIAVFGTAMRWRCCFWQRSAAQSKWVQQLLDETFGNRVATNTIAIRPTVFGHVPCPKYQVDYREMNRKIFVDRFFFDAVMPVVEAWGGNDVLKPSKRDSNI